jgi:hypothetical protein
MAQLTAHRDKLASEFGVQSLAIFGSAARDELTLGSDIDILVEFKPEARVGLFELVALRECLEHLLGCPVDVVTPDGLRMWMRERVLQEAVRVV